MNGARTGANNWTVDGADINDSGSNGTLLNTPSIDAIQEFTLERSNYDASFGRSGGGQIVVATKSGTNQFHGSAYEFNRNNYYNANTFDGRAAIASGQLLSSDDTAPIERYNDFGFTIGGPALHSQALPAAERQDLLFLVGGVAQGEHSGSTNVITVPTAAELAGSFTSPITVAPVGCVTNAGGVSTISSTCFSTNATAYLNAFMVNYPAKYFNGTAGYGLQPVKQFSAGHYPS